MPRATTRTPFKNLFDISPDQLDAFVSAYFYVSEPAFHRLLELIRQGNEMQLQIRRVDEEYQRIQNLERARPNRLSVIQKRVDDLDNELGAIRNEIRQIQNTQNLIYQNVMEFIHFRLANRSVSINLPVPRRARQKTRRKKR